LVSFTRDDLSFATRDDLSFATRDDLSFATRDDLSFALIPGARSRPSLERRNLTPSAGLSTCPDRIRLCVSRRYNRHATM
jgi:hypothetical protein